MRWIALPSALLVLGVVAGCVGHGAPCPSRQDSSPPVSPGGGWPTPIVGPSGLFRGCAEEAERALTIHEDPDASESCRRNALLTTAHYVITTTEVTREFNLHKDLEPQDYLSELAKVLKESNKVLHNPLSSNQEHHLALVRAHLSLTFMERLLSEQGISVHRNPNMNSRDAVPIVPE